jgi:hypothetical protein
MKYETLEQAKQAEYERSLKATDSPQHARWASDRDAAAHVEPNDPPKGYDDPPNPKYAEMEGWYNPATDVLWGYRSYYGGNHGHGYEGDGWRHSITEASRFNPIFAFHRQQYLKKQLEASYA